MNAFVSVVLILVTYKFAHDTTVMQLKVYILPHSVDQKELEVHDAFGSRKQ